METNELEQIRLVLKRFTYSEALLEVLKVRDQRQKIYADDWKQQEDWELLALLKMKIRRLQAFVIGKKDQKVYESIVDTLIDCANYDFFLLQNTLDRLKEETKK